MSYLAAHASTRLLCFVYIAYYFERHTHSPVDTLIIERGTMRKTHVCGLTGNGLTTFSIHKPSKFSEFQHKSRGKERYCGDER